MPKGPKKVKFEWLPVGSGGDLGPAQTFRTAVVGGWLVYTERSAHAGAGDREVTMTFVPDPEHTWVCI